MPERYNCDHTDHHAGFGYCFTCDNETGWADRHSHWGHEAILCTCAKNDVHAGLI